MVLTNFRSWLGCAVEFCTLCRKTSLYVIATQFLDLIDCLLMRAQFQMDLHGRGIARGA